MQCTWPQLARLAFHGFARPSTIIQSHLPASWLVSSKPTSSSRTLFPQQRRLYAAVQTSRDSPSLTTPPGSNAMDQSEQYLLDTADGCLPFKEPSNCIVTQAEIGRTAAQAVRVSVQQGSLGDAYLIVRSLYHGRLSDSPSDAQTNTKPPPSVVESLSFLGEPNGDLIEFSKRVSPRLPAHALLHSLIRRGEGEKAEQLVHGMISIGTRVRRRSLETILEGLADYSSNLPPTLFKPSIDLRSRDVTLLKPHMATNAEFTGGALRILQAARKSGGGSTKKMYRYLITLCIINGEIILASLIFGVLLRDWQAREKAKEAAAAAAASVLEPLSSPATSTLPDSITQAPIANIRDLRSICKFITWNFNIPRTDVSSKLAFSASLQALANLAHDMDQGRLCVNLEPVITAMYSCPRTRQMVWISQDGVVQESVQAYTYFHQVLDRLITSLPEREREQERQRQEAEINKDWTLSTKPLEPINPYTYNALLHYTLRHLHSLDRAHFVLTHLLVGLDNALPLHRNKTKAATLNILERAKKDFPPGAIESLMDDVGLGPAAFDELVAAPEHELDPYALSTRISIMIYMGESHAVVEALPKILPGLFPPVMPRGTPLLVMAKAADQCREDGLLRAVMLGPVVFSALLNALRKAGRTGMAESVFLYGLEAEEKSFETNVNEQNWNLEKQEERTIVIRPWCLPEHAYTTMIQIYNNERMQAHKENPYVVGWGLTPEGRPLLHRREHGRLVDPMRRDVLARRMIVQMYRSMMAAPEALAARLEKLEALVDARQLGELDRSMKEKPKIKIDLGRGKFGYAPPEPDLWFFESLLEMFMKTPEDPLLPALVREMRKTGMAVRANVVEVVKKIWGPAVLEEVVDGAKVVERKRDPLGHQVDRRPRGKKDEVRVPSRMGWKRWTLAEQQRGSKRSEAAWAQDDVAEVWSEVANAQVTVAPVQ